MIINDILNFHLYSAKTFDLTVGHLLGAIVVLFIGMIISRILKRTVGNKITERLKVNKHQNIILQNIFYYICIGITIYVALTVLDIPLSSVTFLLGGVGIGVGLGLQNYFNNVWSGIIMLVEKPFKVGDVVEIRGIIGRVWNIRFRSFQIHTEENIDITMPNSVVLQESIINWTKDDQIILTSVKIGIGYNSDLTLATKVMIEAASSVEGVLLNPSPFVLFREHGSSSLNFEVFFKVKIVNKLVRWEYESKVNYALNEYLRKNQIEIPYPQLDLHVKEGGKV